jgi:hypothetical protein
LLAENLKGRDDMGMVTKVKMLLAARNMTIADLAEKLEPKLQGKMLPQK